MKEPCVQAWMSSCLCDCRAVMDRWGHNYISSLFAANWKHYTLKSLWSLQQSTYFKKPIHLLHTLLLILKMSHCWSKKRWVNSGFPVAHFLTLLSFSVEDLMHLACSSVFCGGGTNQELVHHCLFECSGDVMVSRQFVSTESACFCALQYSVKEMFMFFWTHSYTDLLYS